MSSSSMTSHHGRLHGKVVLITGAGGAIGRRVACMMAAEGARIAACDVNDAAVRETARLINNDTVDDSAVAHVVDVTNETQVQEWVSSVHTKWGCIDVLVNNAAAFVFGKVTHCSSNDWDRVLGVNVKGYATTMKCCVPIMESQEHGGAIVNIASISSFVAQDSFVPYNASKGAILQLTRCVAMDHGKNGVRCNSVCPGFIHTPATGKHAASLGITEDELIAKSLPDHFVNRVGCTDDVGYAVIYLASNESTFVTGQHLVVDGGYTAH